MIGYVKGTISHLFNDHCFVDVQGVGYRVYIPMSTRQQLSVGNSASLFTYLNVREDALMLFGFFTQEEYQIFLQLVSVSGIGPKVAIGILSAVTPRDLQLAICQNSIGTLTRIPGIGKKTAERLILELKDKVGIISDGAVNEAALPSSSDLSPASASAAAEQAVQALIALGYSQGEIAPVIRKITVQGNNESLSVQGFIKLALKEFGQK